MSQESILAEAVEKLARLRRLPSTPMRVREITSLLRLIESGAKPEKVVRISKKRILSGNKSKRADDLYDEDDDESPSTQTRVVEKRGMHRRITVSKKEPEQYPEKDEEETYKKEHKQSLSDIQALLGSSFRGFS